MTRLTTEQVKKNGGDGKGSDDSYSSVSLTRRALTDVSCLSEFRSLERLDLAFNSLSSLEGLKSCENLKWLSVTQNKLESLHGVEGLRKLTVLNASKNKIKSMEPLLSLDSLRALILNDNEIETICKLGRMKELNTLVLSRNPICEISDSLKKVKSIAKISLSRCKVQAIGSSLKSCTELKELRLAHNYIKTLPSELADNKKLQNVDVGNNAVTSWSDIKVLCLLTSLKNLNLSGNPVADNSKLTNKLKNVLSQLHVFNAKPLLKNTETAKPEMKLEEKKRKIRFLEIDELPASMDENIRKEERKNRNLREKSDKFEPLISENETGDIGNGSDNPSGEAGFVKKKHNNNNSKPLDIPVFEIGLGGPSTWGDE